MRRLTSVALIIAIAMPLTAKVARADPAARDPGHPGFRLHVEQAQLISLPDGVGIRPHARTLAPLTVFDPNDTGRRLDIRWVSATVTSEETRITVVFWNRVAPWFLARHAARIEMEIDAGGYAFRFAPNKAGWLRVTFGELGSNCCIVSRARHPDRYTYTSVVPTSGSLFPLPTRFRAVTTGKLDCRSGGRRCGLSGGKLVDSTSWERF